MLDVERTEAVSLSHHLHPRFQRDDSVFTILGECLNDKQYNIESINFFIKINLAEFSMDVTVFIGLINSGSIGT